MAVVTISRGTFSGGNELAARVAGRLGYRLVSRELLFERAAETYGVCAEELTELMNRMPTLHDPDTKKAGQRLLAAVQASLCDLLVGDDVVYHGQVAHLLLSGVKHVFRVRLIAPRVMRVRMAMDRERLSEFEASRKVDLVDAERERWTKFFYGADVNDPTLYDMVLNLEQLSIEDAAAIVVNATRQPSNTTDDESRGRLRDLALASRIRASLMADDETAGLELHVEAENGKVKLGGLLSEAALAKIAETLKALPGVTMIETVSLQ